MQVNNQCFDQLHYTVKLFKHLLDIQTRQPTPEEANALMIALSELGLTKDLIETDSLKAVQIQMGRFLDELTLTYGELDSFNPLVPKSCESVLIDLHDRLANKSETLRSFFNKDEFDSQELVSFFTPLPNDTLDHSPAYDDFKTLFHLFIEELIVLVESDLSHPHKLEQFERRLEEAEIADYTLRFFDLVNYQEATPMDVTFGELKSHIDKIDQDLVDGMEHFGRLFDQAILTNVSGTEAGWVDSLKAGLKKAGEAIINAFKTLFNFFTGQKKDLSARKKEYIEECKKNVDALKELDQTTTELDESIIEKTKSMFEKAKLPECAAFFNNVNDISAAIGAFNSAISWLEQNADKTDEADKAGSEADAATKELVNFNPDIKDDATSDEKASVKEEKTTLLQKAKDAAAKYREKVKEALVPISGLSKLPAIIKNAAKPKAKKEVAGTEEWML